MTRYFIGAVAAAALALAGCNDHHAGQGYSGNQKQQNGNDSAYQTGYDSNADLHNNGNGANTSVSGVSGNGDTAHQNDFNNQNNDDINKNAATGRGLSGNEQNPANTPKGQLMSINGTVKDTGGGGLTLVTGNKGEIKLDTGDFTKVVGLNGQKVDKGDIKEGSEVRAAYKFDGKSNKAMTITITRSPVTNAEQKGTMNRTDKQQKQEQNAADPSKNP